MAFPFPVLRPKDNSKAKTAKCMTTTYYYALLLRPCAQLLIFFFVDRIVPHPPLHPAGSVESIAHALNRITQRQNARKYAARRPVVSALKAASLARMATADEPSSHQERSEEQDGTCTPCDVIAVNSNNSNSREYATPVPSRSTKISQSLKPSSAISDSKWRNFPLCVQTDQNAHSQVTPNSSNVQTVHAGTHFSTSPTFQSLKDHPSMSCDNNSKHNMSGRTADASRYHHSTSTSLDLLRRIQLHNKAISHYIEMQRLHQAPSSAHQPSSKSTTAYHSRSHLSHNKEKPTPTSLIDSHDYSSTPAPTFKFVVPHPPTTPKPNFIPESHRGVFKMAPFSM